MNGMIIVLCGPSGAGKGFVYQEILSRRSNVKRIPSVTSREIREDDIPGTTYTFVKKEEFEDMISKDMFFESILFDSNYYGTLRIPEEELSEFDIFFDKDVRVAIKIKEVYPEDICIYLMPKDLETLIKRRGER